MNNPFTVYFISNEVISPSSAAMLMANKSYNVPNPHEVGVLSDWLKPLAERKQLEQFSPAPFSPGPVSISSDSENVNEVDQALIDEAVAKYREQEKAAHDQQQAFRYDPNMACLNKDDLVCFITDNIAPIQSDVIDDLPKAETNAIRIEMEVVRFAIEHYKSQPGKKNKAAAAQATADHFLNSGTTYDAWQKNQILNQLGAKANKRTRANHPEFPFTESKGN
jgi:hypothetical protein